MVNLRGLIVGFIFSMLLTSCGMTELAEQARDLSAQANEGVAESNQTSKEMLLLQLKMLEFMQRTDELTRQLQALSEGADEKMAITVERMRQQTVAIALEGILNPENSEELDPPTKLIPYAKTLAEEANEAELTEFAYILWNDVRYGSAPLGKKEVSLTTLSLIAGFIPNAKMRRIEAAQIDGRGVYEEHTYKMLWGRYSVIRDLHFDSYVTESTTLNKGSLKHVIDYFNELKYIAELSYVAKIQVSIPLMITNSVNPSEIATLKTKAKNAFNAKMSAQEKLDPEVIELMKTFD